VSAAAALARKGKRVLVVDSDPHAAASFHLRMGLDAQPFVTLYDVLTGKCKLKDAIEETAYKGLHVVRGEDRLKDLYKMQTISPTLFEEISGDYDYLFLDTPPAASPYRDLLMILVDEVLVPMFAEPDSIEGLVRQLTEWSAWSDAKARAGKGSISLLGVVVTHLNERYATHRNVLKDIKKELSDKGIPLLAVIPSSGAASNAADTGVPIPWQSRLKANQIYKVFITLGNLIEKAAGKKPVKGPIVVETNDSLSGEIEL
jgi:chromosome partitioning protein